MPITVQCPTCGQASTMPDDLIGKTVRCRACQSRFTIAPPTPAANPSPTSFEFNQQAPTRPALPAPASSGVRGLGATAANLARLAIWIVVTFWCLSPIGWGLFVSARSLANAPRERPPIERFDRFGPAQAPDAGLVASVMGSVAMLGAFTYGVWCSVGVIMGFGLDRTVTVAESLFFGRKSS